MTLIAFDDDEYNLRQNGYDARKHILLFEDKIYALPGLPKKYSTKEFMFEMQMLVQKLVY
jgi:hypothetical protein